MTATQTPAAVATPDQMQPQAYAPADGKGLIASMDEFFDGLDTTKSQPAPTKAVETPVAPPVEPVKAVESTPAPTAKEAPVKPVEELETIEENFFKGDDKEVEVKDPAVFDEVAFDKETEEQVKGMDAKAGEKFKALKAELKAAKQAAPPATLTKELEELRVKAAEADGLRERLKETSAASAKLYVENDDDYIREVKQPWTDVHAKLDKLSEVYELDPSILRALVREEDMKVQDEMIKTHLANFSEVRKQEVFQSIGKVSDLLDKHDKFMKEAEATVGAREAKRIEATEKLLAEQKKAVQTIQTEKWSRWEKAIPGLLDDDGKPTPEYTKMKNEALSLDFSQARANDMAFAALSGVLLPFAQKQIVSLQRELNEYRASDKRSVKAKPSTGDSVTTTPVSQPKTKGFLDGFLTADLA